MRRDQATADVCFTLLTAGHCMHPEFITVRGGSFRPCKFPAAFALIRHPTAGTVLFDTGYSPEFFAATSGFPYRLYACVTPVHLAPSETAAAQLQRLGIAPESVGHVILSHFHADHVAALRDFPRATFHFMHEAYDAVRGRTGLAALRAGYLPSLLPPDFSNRMRTLARGSLQPLPNELAPFSMGFDLFDDGTVWGVPLPGHADGHLGVYFAAHGMSHFLVGDACWSKRAFTEHRYPHWLAEMIVADKRVYRETVHGLGLLHARNPHLNIIPSHCAASIHSAMHAHEHVS